MKRVFLFLLFVSVLAGCAAGINHNVVTLNDKPYLVETKTYAFLIAEWSAPSTLTALHEPLEISQGTSTAELTAAPDQLKAIIEKCRLKDGLSSRNVNYRLLYKCVVEELAELDK